MPHTILRLPSDTRVTPVLTGTYTLSALPLFRGRAIAAIKRKHDKNDKSWCDLTYKIEFGLWVYSGSPKENCPDYNKNLRGVLGSLRYFSHVGLLLTGYVQPLQYCIWQHRMHEEMMKKRFARAIQDKIAAANRARSNQVRSFVATVKGMPQCFNTHKDYLDAVEATK